MLVRMWQDILQALEDPRAAVLLTSIDFAKAFNRLKFDHCLTTLRDKGASNPALKVVSSKLALPSPNHATFWVVYPRDLFSVSFFSIAALTRLKLQHQRSTTTRVALVYLRLSWVGLTLSLSRMSQLPLTTDIYPRLSGLPWKSTSTWMTTSSWRS